MSRLQERKERSISLPGAPPHRETELGYHVVIGGGAGVGAPFWHALFPARNSRESQKAIEDLPSGRPAQSKQSR
jgi:hypothetical protein